MPLEGVVGEEKPKCVVSVMNITFKRMHLKRWEEAAIFRLILSLSSHCVLCNP